jgi:hypothetical protein
MSKRKHTEEMSYDQFEREYADQVSWRVETLIGEGEYQEDEYDEAYEVAIEQIAQEEGIYLV